MSAAISIPAKMFFVSPRNRSGDFVDLNAGKNTDSEVVSNQ